MIHFDTLGETFMIHLMDNHYWHLIKPKEAISWVDFKVPKFFFGSKVFFLIPKQIIFLELDPSFEYCRSSFNFGFIKVYIFDYLIFFKDNSKNDNKDSIAICLNWDRNLISENCYQLANCNQQLGIFP